MILIEQRGVVGAVLLALMVSGCGRGDPKPPSSGWSVLHSAADGGDANLVRQLLKSNPALVNADDGDGHTPLHVAAIYGRRSCAEWLLAHGADLEARDSFGDTPLATAAVFGMQDLYQLLIERGADAGVPGD